MREWKLKTGLFVLTIALSSFYFADTGHAQSYSLLGARNYDCFDDDWFPACIDFWGGVNWTNIGGVSIGGITDSFVNAFVNRTGDTMTGGLNITDSNNLTAGAMVILNESREMYISYPSVSGDEALMFDHIGQGTDSRMIAFPYGVQLAANTGPDGEGSFTPIMQMHSTGYIQFQATGGTNSKVEIAADKGFFISTDGTAGNQWAILKADGITSNRLLQFPNYNGTLALTRMPFDMNISKGTGFVNISATGNINLTGNIFMRDNQLELHDLGSELTFLDALTKNTVTTGINGSLSGTIFTISELDSNNISVNINETQHILNRTIDSIVIVEGTNQTPVFNQGFYQDINDPRLAVRNTLSTLVPSAFTILMGKSFVYASATGAATGERHIGDVLTRLFKQGPLYESGFDISVTSSEINISTGIMTIIASTQAITSNHSTTDLYIEIHADGEFHQHVNNISGLDEYSTGESISNAKFFNVVCLIAATHDNVGRQYCAVQNKPNTEHSTALSAELDSDFIVFFPPNNFVSQLSTPVVRVVMRRLAGVNIIVAQSSGMLFTDVRGKVTSIGGVAPLPVTPIWVETAGDTMTGGLNIYNGANFVNMTTSGDINMTGNLTIGGQIGILADLDLLTLFNNLFVIQGDQLLGGNMRVDGGNIGITGDTDLMQLAANAVTINGALDTTNTITATKAGFPVFDLTRTSGNTNTIFGVGRITHQTANNMVDGFGSFLQLSVTDSGVSNSAMGGIAGYRDGSDTEGAVALFAGTGGSEQLLTVRANGNVGIGDTTPTEKLTVDGNINVTGNVIAGGFIDQSGFYTGDALAALRLMTYDIKVPVVSEWGQVLHSSLGGAYVNYNKTIDITEMQSVTNCWNTTVDNLTVEECQDVNVSVVIGQEEVEFEGRDLGDMVAYLVRGIQQLDEENDALRARIGELEKEG